MASRGAKKRQRLKYLQELARESILKYAPKPLTPEEIKEYELMKWFESMVKEISHALYHAPSMTTGQRKFDHVPEKSIRQLLIEFEERLKKQEF
jgi:Icc-related predicted phosphoesterase